MVGCRSLAGGDPRGCDMAGRRSSIADGICASFGGGCGVFTGTFSDDDDAEAASETFAFSNDAEAQGISTARARGKNSEARTFSASLADGDIASAAGSSFSLSEG